MENKNVILCMSGGIDSTAAYYFLGKPKTVFFDFGEYTREEKKAVLDIAPDTIIDTTLNFEGLLQGRNAYIPYRNLMFAIRAAAYGDDIYIAGIKDDMVSDKTPKAFELMANVMNSIKGDGDNRKQVLSPFWDMTKSEVVAWMLENVPNAKEVLESTFSCYEPTENGEECKSCPACFRKWNAMWDNSISTLFLNRKLMMEYSENAKVNWYIPERNESILRCVEEYKTCSVDGYKDETRPMVWVVDIDGVLTVETDGYGEEVYKNRTPNEVNIAWLRKLYDSGDRIHLHTARHEEDREVTISWLAKHLVPFHFLTLGKPKGDFYVDDKMVSVKDAIGASEEEAKQLLSEFQKLLDAAVAKRKTGLFYTGDQRSYGK